MNYYALQVQTGAEKSFINRIEKKQVEANYQNFRVYFPQRILKIRKFGRTKEQVLPIFSGYIFAEVDTLSEEIYWILRLTKGFYRFLPNNKEPHSLVSGDLHLLQHFLALGSTPKLTQVCFDENDRICILEGVFKGFEGNIIKVDKRKSRARIVLDMFNHSFPIDFSFNAISSIDTGKKE